MNDHLPRPVDPERCAEAQALAKFAPLQLTEQHFEQLRLISPSTEVEGRDRQRAAQLAAVETTLRPVAVGTKDAQQRGEQLADIIEGIIRKQVAAIMVRIVALERANVLDIDPADPESMQRLAIALVRCGLTDAAAAGALAWIADQFLPPVPPPASADPDRPRVH